MKIFSLKSIEVSKFSSRGKTILVTRPFGQSLWNLSLCDAQTSSLGGQISCQCYNDICNKKTRALTRGCIHIHLIN